ncbi:MAG: hypothetical protein DRJ01_08545 [Bacteroidetes bacterium]|nr:MAG: hypothetical protein DRJ01_08545 [Bacteroidota bacterium]
MKHSNPVKFLEDNITDIETDFNKTNNNSKENFKTFYNNLIITAQELLKILDKEQEIEELLTGFCSAYSIKKKGFVRYWLIKAFDNEILHYRILTHLVQMERKAYEDYNDNERFRTYPAGSNVTHIRNKELFKKKFGLTNRKTYIEKRKFLEASAQSDIEKYLMLLNDLSAFTKDNRNIVYPGLSNIEFYNELYETTKKELELLDRKEETRLFEENSLSYFISEDILAQLYSILKEEWLTNGKDEERLWRLLRFGSTLGKKISLDMTPVRIAHTFYQLSEKKLIAKNTSAELAEWLYTYFELRRRGGEDNLRSPDTIRSYIDKRRKSDKGQEIFKVIRIRKTKNEPAFAIIGIDE